MEHHVKQLLISALHNHIDPEGWVLIYGDMGTASMTTNFDLANPVNKDVCLQMIDAMRRSIEGDEATKLQRINPQDN